VVPLSQPKITVNNIVLGVVYGFPTPSFFRRSKLTSALTKVMSVAVVIALGFALGFAPGARAAEPPRGAGTEYEVSYRGRVVDEWGQPLEAAKVAVIGTPLSATTGADGGFAIQGTARRGVEIGAAPGVPAVGESAERFCPLEVTARGCVARTILPDAANMDGMTVAVWALPVEGQPADLGRFAYRYRKAAWDNPPETQFIASPDHLLRGFLWGEHRPAFRVEVEFAKGQAVPKAEELLVQSVWGTSWWSNMPMTHSKRTPHQFSADETPGTTDRGTTVLTFRRNQLGVGHGRDGSLSLAVFSTGTAKEPAISAVRVYGQTTIREKNENKTVDIQWASPRVVEVEWGFQADRPGEPLSGRIECYNGHVGAIEPLEADNGLATLGAHHWRESPAAPGKRRGFSVKVFPTNGGRVPVTLWTSGEAVCFALDDLERGPILVPSTGYFVTLAGSGVSARQFQEQLAAKRLKTRRQQIRTEPELSLTDVLAAAHKDKPLPEVPVPASAPPMQIDVPDKILNGLWKLCAWDIQDATEKLNGPVDPEMAQRMVGRIFRREIPDPAPKTGANIRTVNIYGRNAGFDTIGQESNTCIQAMDFSGMGDFAEGGLNFWFLAQKRGMPSPLFTDGDGYLLLHPYDTRHSGGHGHLLRAAATHYHLTGDTQWLRSVAPVVKKACEWILRQQKQWKQTVGERAWSYGILPPASTGDYTQSPDTFHYISTILCDGLQTAAAALADAGVEGAEGLVKDAEILRQDLRAVGYRSAALFPVVRTDDGTYRRYINGKCYTRDFSGENAPGGIMFLFHGVYGVHEPIAQEILDVVGGGRINGNYHIIHDIGTMPHLMDDDIPLFLRMLFAQWSMGVFPFSGYGHFGGVPKADWYKGGTPNAGYTSMEGALLERARHMLVFEMGDTLWLAKATPRPWLKQGKKIAIKNAPTYFGTVAYEIVSDLDNGTINATVEMPARKPPQNVVLRFRHPTSAPIKAVTVNGKPWTEFNADKETITLKGLNGTVTVSARY
jgi:hypothetical protein